MKNRSKAIAIYVIAYFFLALVCFCRLYLGRHSLDQVILGLEIGFLHTDFTHNVFKPYLFDPIFYPNPREDPDHCFRRARKAFIYSVILYVLLIVKIFFLYEFVERNQIIPDQWLESIYKTCPVFKKNHLFHYFTLSHTGLITIVPLQYFWNYLRLKNIKNNGIQ